MGTALENRSRPEGYDLRVIPVYALAIELMKFIHLRTLRF
jgi:hypothetical protein